MRCASCGSENPPGFRFCGACGAALAAARLPSGEERKLVTVLFCDLVGFTARSDQADPEDVGAMLRPYHVRLRAEMDLVIAFSACPQDILQINGKAGKPVEAHFTIS